MTVDFSFRVFRFRVCFPPGLGFFFVMGDEGSVFAVRDDFDGGFEFEDDDKDLTIDIEMIYRILDEKPDSAEVGSLRILKITRN